MDLEQPKVIVPWEPTEAMVRAGIKALDAWSDDALVAEVDGAEMAGRVWKAMTSSATMIPPGEPLFGGSDDEN